MNLRPLNVVLGNASTDFIRSYLAKKEPRGQAENRKISPAVDKRRTIGSLCYRQESTPIRSNESECHWAALVPRKPGPRRAHKLDTEVMDFVQQLRNADASLRPAQLADRVGERFGRSVHPRSVERALARREKKRR